MDSIQASFAWTVENKLTVLAVAVWILVNVAPRPHPEQSEGWKKWVWLVLDRLSILTSNKLPGKLKWLFASSPLPTPPPSPPAAEPNNVKKEE